MIFPINIPGSPHKYPPIIATVKLITTSAIGAHMSWNKPYPCKNWSVAPLVYPTNELKIIKNRIWLGIIYSAPNHSEIKASVSWYRQKEIVPAIRKRKLKSSQKTIWMCLVFPSAIRLPTPALVLLSRLLMSWAILSIMSV